MQATGYASYGRAEKPGGNGGVILRLTRAGCCYRSLTGGTKEGRKQIPRALGPGPPGGSRSYSRGCLVGAEAMEKILPLLDTSPKAEMEGEKYYGISLSPTLQSLAIAPH